MSFRKSIALLLALVCAVAAFSMVASADTTVSVGGASYKVVSPQSVAITGEGVTPSYRGNGSIDVLIDGDIARSVTNHDQKGIVLIVNDEIAARATTPVVQDVDNIPTASIEMDFGSAVSFDTAYMAIYWQQAGIYEPDGNRVIIETSDDGVVWVPVGTDGSYYFSIPKCPDWEEGLPNSDQGYPYVGEVAIPLGETVKAQYVRYSYTFPVLEEGSHWTFYTNVAEFIGFTEVGVANFESGRKPAVLTAEDVADRPAIEGTWVFDLDDVIMVVTFADEKGEMEFIAYEYDKTEFEEKGTEAEVQFETKGNYFIEGDTLVVIDDGGYDEYTVSFDEDGNMILDEDGEEFVYTPFDELAGSDDEPSDEPSDKTSDADASVSDETPAESSAAVSSESSTPAESSTGSSNSAGNSAGNTNAGNTNSGNGADSSDGSTEESSFPIWLIACIGGGVVVIAAVIVVIVKKKK